MEELECNFDYLDNSCNNVETLSHVILIIKYRRLYFCVDLIKFKLIKRHLYVMSAITGVYF